jgi:hypothetical protein
VQRTEARRDRVPFLEVLVVDRAALDRLEIRDAAERLLAETSRLLEL